MIATFVVCWMLLYGANAGQENCTPEMGYDQAQTVMTTIAKAGASYSDLSIRLAPTVPSSGENGTVTIDKHGLHCDGCRKGGGG